VRDVAADAGVDPALWSRPATWPGSSRWRSCRPRMSFRWWRRRCSATSAARC